MSYSQRCSPPLQDLTDDGQRARLVVRVEGVGDFVFALEQLLQEHAAWIGDAKADG